MRGFRFSLETMLDEASKINLVKSVPALQMPVFFFLGRRDRWVPPETSVAYFEALAAPSKTLVWFEQSGHEPFVDEPDKFNAAMVELVRLAVAERWPLAAAAPAPGFGVGAPAKALGKAEEERVAQSLRPGAPLSSMRKTGAGIAVMGSRHHGCTPPPRGGR